MAERLIREIEDSGLLRSGDRIVLACSGGADSLALTECLYRMKEANEWTITVLYIHHGLREEADREIDFLKEYCNQRNIPFAVRYINVNERVIVARESMEEAARTLRYGALLQYAKENNANKIALAHHANDQAETVVFHLIRGCGLHGLSGMDWKRETAETTKEGDLITFVRPFLKVNKSEIKSFLTKEHINWCEDRSNNDTEIDRNRIRHLVFPELETVNSEAVMNINACAEYAVKANRYFTELAVRKLTDGDEIPITVLDQEPEIVREYIVIEKMRQMGFQMKDIGAVHIGMILSLISKPVGKEAVLPNGIRIVRTYSGIRFYQAESMLIDECPVSCPESMKMRVFNWDRSVDFPRNEYTKWFDYDRIKDTPILRYREEGDLISTLNGSRKKLKDFMIDEKIPREIRDRIPLVASGKEILWVVGYRMNESYKITESTERVLEITVPKEDIK